MTRNLKALGLALIAVFAMSALAAQGASAAEAHHFTTEETNTDLTGHTEGPQVLSAGAATVTCQTATFKGTSSEKTAISARVTPTYPEKYLNAGKEEQNCKLGAQNVTVTNNGCDYIFKNQTATNTPTTPRKDAQVSLECNMTGSITIVGAGVTIHFSDTHPVEKPVNQNLKGVRYTQIVQGGKNAITVDASVHGVAYECTGGANCTAIGLAATGTNGKLTGNGIVQAYKSGSNHEAADLQNLTLNENVT